MPKFNESDAMGRAGVHEVALLLSEMKWIFREQQVCDSGLDPTLQVLACTTRERHSDRRRGSAPVRGFAGNAIQAVGLRERIHPTRSFHPTLCPFLAIGTGNPWGEVLDREFWHLREVHPSDETRNHHLGLSPLYFIARR